MELRSLLKTIVANPSLHIRWLNTLSYLENCGARKISRYEHPTKVREEMLKHAAEEFRHAHDLKRQLFKLTPFPPTTYALSSLLGGFQTLRYLDRLELMLSRSSKEGAYLLVSYAIEMRALSLYPLYHTVLKEMGSKVSIRAILFEEEQHLSEIREEMGSFQTLAPLAESIEQKLFDRWCTTLFKEVEVGMTPAS